MLINLADAEGTLPRGGTYTFRVSYKLPNTNNWIEFYNIQYETDPNTGFNVIPLVEIGRSNLLKSIYPFPRKGIPLDAPDTAVGQEVEVDTVSSLFGILSGFRGTIKLLSPKSISAGMQLGASNLSEESAGQRVQYKIEMMDYSSSTTL